MRPTIGEQLGGTCRILEEVIAPEVASPHAAEALRGLVKNLRMLETGWGAVLPFLHWDNAETAALLQRARPAVPAGLAERIGTCCATPRPDPFDVSATQQRNDALRGLLSEVVAGIDAEAPVHGEIVAHLRVRTGRYPMRSVPDLPRAAGSEL